MGTTGYAGHGSAEEAEDPCKGWGPTQRWALVWFIAIVIGGSIFVCKLSSIDKQIIAIKGDLLDYDAYRKNRLAQAGVKREFSDPRAHAHIPLAGPANDSVHAAEPAAPSGVALDNLIAPQTMIVDESVQPADSHEH